MNLPFADGSFDAVSNPTGWIWGPNLKANAIRHESGLVQSHYVQFVSANSADNPGANVERLLGSPGTSADAFAQRAKSRADEVVNAIKSATDTPEPHADDRDASGVFQGFINFAPYGTGCHP